VYHLSKNLFIVFAENRIDGFNNAYCQTRSGSVSDFYSLAVCAKCSKEEIDINAFTACRYQVWYDDKTWAYFTQHEEMQSSLKSLPCLDIAFVQIQCDKRLDGLTPLSITLELQPGKPRPSSNFVRAIIRQKMDGDSPFMYPVLGYMNPCNEASSE
jgi:hypothetical protein